jgi:hypothetical protein
MLEAAAELVLQVTVAQAAEVLAVVGVHQVHLAQLQTQAAAAVLVLTAHLAVQVL